MTFFPARWTAPEPPKPDPRGWAAYVEGGLRLPDIAPERIADDVEVVDTPAARIRLTSVDAYPDALTLEVRCELREVRGGEALRDLVDAGREERDGCVPPRSGLLVGLELGDGTRVRTYAVGPDDRGPRLLPRSGGASAEPGRPSTTRDVYGLAFLPDLPFQVVCSWTAVGVREARAVVDRRAVR